MSDGSPGFPQGLLIYNLFPRLIGWIDGWYRHVDRAAAMKFNTIYLNPFHYPGFSGSLYAPKNYYEYNPLFMDQHAGADSLKFFCKHVHAKGMKVVMDLVINHTAVDAVLVDQHPAWYLRNADGSIRHPQAMDPADARRITVWGDLAEIDNEHSPDKTALWTYWKDLVAFYLNVGFDGFRCDAAYQVPVALWHELIARARSVKGNCLFIAETLGCKEDAIAKLSECGFDYIYNSSKWWNFRDDWFMRQYGLAYKHAASVSFPETHDTTRLYADVNNNEAIVKLRYQFAALLTKGCLMPIGYEFGFMRKLDVVSMQPQDWENPRIDLVDFIARVNDVKLSKKIFNEDNELRIVNSGNPNVFCMLKTSLNRTEQVLFIINLNDRYEEAFYTDNLPGFMALPENNGVQDLSVEYRMEGNLPAKFHYVLHPSQMRVLYATVPAQWWG